FKETMEIQELTNILSQIQFKQELSIETYIIILCVSGLGAWFASYFKTKGQNFANKEDFEQLQKQLESNTTVVEEIKTELSQKNWISQQAWVKKQEAYEAIFDCLFHVKKYVAHEKDEYFEWEHYNFRFPELAYETTDEYTIRIWEHEKEEYLKKSQDPETKAQAEKLKVKYDESFAKLFHVIEVKAIYLDQRVTETITVLKQGLSKTDNEEDWDEHFFRISRLVNESVDKLRTISIEELKIKT
ncbi:TPA: hypothetical protein ACF33V_004533, partial [Vibrio parahaemolyticus]